MNTNVSDYSIVDLLNILEIDVNEDDLTPQLIINKTNDYITRFKKENNLTLSTFFNNVQIRLLTYLKDDNAYTNNENDYEQEDDEEDYNDDNDDNDDKNQIPLPQLTQNWVNNQYLTQDSKSQNDKITNRKNNIQTFPNEHLPMKKNTLGVSNTFNVPVAQGVLNPNLKNITTRIINLDSQYRETILDSKETSTDYTLNLSEPLVNVLSLRLYSFQIPYTWYCIDSEYGNNFFWISFVNTSGEINDSVKIQISSGNYNTTTFTQAITASLTIAGFDFSATSRPGEPIYIAPTNNKVSLLLYGGTYGTETIDEKTIITFFDFNSKIKSDEGDIASCNTSSYINQTLGWIMGFREPSINVNLNGNVSEAIINLYGSRYFILVLDDLNQNHLNDGLVTITETSKTIKLPKYYTPTLPYTCTEPNPTSDEPNNVTYSSSAQVLPSAPRVLTQSQIYSINEIIKNNEKTLDYKTKSPNVSDTFAVIPLKIGSMSLGDVYVDFGGSLQDNKRDYFGPVNIVRLRIKLLDDRGNVVNLNGNDWSITLISESLYQY
jgi:hypothetical protein